MATPAAARAPTGSQAAERMIPISSLHPAYVPFMHYPHEQGLIVLPIQAVLSMAHAYAPQTMMSFPYAFGYPPAMAGMHPAVAAHQAGVNGSQHPVSHSAVLPAASTVGEVPTTASSTPSPATPARNGDGPRSSKRRRTDPLQAAVSTKVLSSAEGAERQRRRARTCRICVNAGHPETAHSCPGRGSRALCPNNPRNQNNTAEQDDDEDADGDIVPADEMDDVDADLQDEATVNALTFPAQTSNPPPPAAIPVPAAYGYPQPVHMLAPNVQPNPVYQTAYPYTFQGAYPTAVRMANYPGQPQGAMPMMQGPAPVAGSVVYVTPTQQRERVSKRGPRHCVVCNLTGHAAEGATCPGRGSRKLCPHYVPEQHGHQEDISMEAQLSEQMDNLLQHA
ncbi:hypothetical protein CALCODRAFT_212065 [Calocera cornea HHB12733]|uniref:Uncharacterized protein n=1 Tax=Calocera cornea HHB12733 TaxID=1353952 RepID=A0A165HA01_9BASI|nr:hypothetical protein CALCODRAFT_212065 [Calocera cornea HHB12733]